MSYTSDYLRTAVIQRAWNCCEYCLLHQNYAGFAHEVDHIIAEKHGGATKLANLAYACKPCNRFKRSDIASIDFETGELTRFYHPRQQQWEDHFELDGPTIVPVSQIGHVTERLLKFKQAERLILRKQLVSVHRYPFLRGVPS